MQKCRPIRQISTDWETIPSLSGTFGIRSKLTHYPKMPKKPSSPSRIKTEIAKPDKTKISTKMTRKWLIINNAQHITPGIFNCRTVDCEGWSF